MAQVVGEQAGSAPLKGRQPRERFGPKAVKAVRKAIEWIGRRQHDRHVAYQARRGPDPGEWIGSHVRVAAQRRRLRAIQKEQVRQRSQTPAHIPWPQISKVLDDGRRRYRRLTK